MRFRLSLLNLLARPAAAARKCASERFANLASAVVCTDLKDRIVYLNPAAQALLGCPELEFLGKPCGSTLQLRPVHLAGKVHELETADGRTVLLLVNSRRLRDARGRIRGFVLLLYQRPPETRS